MAGNKDFLNILREVRGTGAPGATPTDGIWYELTIADIDGNPGIYGDILAKYGIVTESAGTFDQAVAILENLNVEVTTLPAGSEATSALVDGVWQLGIPQGTNGIDGNDGFTPDVSINYVNGSLVYTVAIDGTEVINNTLIDLELLVDSVVNSNVDVQTTLQAKQDVVDAVADAQAISDGLDANVAGKLVEINDHTAVKIGELDSASAAEQAEIVATGDAKIAEYDSNAEDRLQEYDDNHTNKLGAYDANDATKIAEYNYNHTERLDDLNFAYADRIIDMIKTRNFMGIMDEYVAQTETHMIPFLSTDDENYIYYGNGVLLEEGVDYTIYDGTTIELTVKTNPYDVIVQVNTQVLNDMLTAEGVLFNDRIGQPNGVASLDENALVPASQLPSYVDDVIEVATYADLPAIGENDKIYVVVADETQGGNTTSYRWATSTYAIVSNNLTATDVKTLYESNLDTNAFTDDEKTKLAATEISSQLDSRDSANRDRVNHTGTQSIDTITNSASHVKMTVEEQEKVNRITVTQAVDLDKVEADTDLNNVHRSSNGSDHTFIDQDVTSSASPTFANITVPGTVDGRDISVDGAKLDTIEAGATADQTAEEIKTAYESNADTNALTDALKTLLETRKVKNVSTDALNDKLVITYTDDTVANLNINDIITDVHVNGAILDATTNVLTLTSADGGADVTVDLSDFVNSSELTNVLSNHYTKNESNTNFEPKNANIQSHISSTANPHGVTKAQVGLGNVDNTADSTKVVASAGKWTTARTITLGGDLSGSTTFDGSGNVTLSAQVADDSHNHVISNVDGLQDALDSKANQSTTYTKTEVDDALALKVDDTEIASVNLLRADKYLAAQNVVNMSYNLNSKLEKVQYNNATDVDYEVLSYNTDGKLSNVAHYVGGVLKGNTVLSYSNGKLVAAPFTGV